MITRLSARLASVSNQLEPSSQSKHLPISSKAEIMPRQDTALAAVMERLDQLSADFKLVRQEIRDSVEFANKTAAEAKQVASDAKQQVGDLKIELDKVSGENAYLKREVSQLKESMLRQEEYSRRSNILLHGINEVDGERPGDCLKTVYKILSDAGIENPETIKIERCHRLGPKPKAARVKPKPRPIIFKLNWYMDKENIMSHASNLDGNLRLTSDYPAVIQERRSVLFPIYHAAKRLGRNPRMPSDRLYIGNMSYTVDNLDKLPAELQPDVVSVRKVENITAFFGKHCPLSNFYPAHFEVDGTTYKSSEQYLQHAKAQLMKDDETAAKILEAESPEKCKSLAREIKGMDWQVWKTEAPNLVKPGLIAKFSQNETCLACLLKTGASTLAEASPTDKLWGIGLHLGHRDVGNQQKWTGTNFMGNLLQEVRETLKDA